MRFTVQSIATLSRSNWNLEMLVPEAESGKPENLEKNLSEQGRKPTERRVLSPMRHPCPPNDKNVSFPELLKKPFATSVEVQNSLTVPAQRKGYCIVKINAR